MIDDKTAGDCPDEAISEPPRQPRKTLAPRKSRPDAAESGAPRGLRTRFRTGGLKPRHDPPPAGIRRNPADAGGGTTWPPAAPAQPDTASQGPRPAARARPPAHAPARSLLDSPDPRGVRLSKLMAERGLCSRREADWIIERGWVFVDGHQVSELGARVSPSVAITLAPEAMRRQAERVTILLHKPVGYVSGQAEDGHQPAVVLIRPDNQFDRDTAPRFDRSHLRGLAPAGRLDIDSTGLLVLTQDGRIARTLIGDDSPVDKEYLVRVEGRLDAEGLALLNHGLELDGRQLRMARVERINDHQLRFVLREGRKRQIRRMCELLGLRVTGLKRVRIGRVKLGDLPVGQWRFLRGDEFFS